MLERGRIAERWRSERWDSLRLLTPNWMNRLPDWSYQGDDPDGFMTATEYVASLEQYAPSLRRPLSPAQPCGQSSHARRLRVESSRGTGMPIRGDRHRTLRCAVCAGDGPVSASFDLPVTPTSIAAPPNSRMAASSSLARLRPACSSPRKSSVRPTGDISVSRHTRLPRLTVATTSCGGWRPASWRMTL